MGDWLVYDWSTSTFVSSAKQPICPMNKVPSPLVGPTALYSSRINTTNFTDGHYLIVYTELNGHPLPGATQDRILIVQGSSFPIVEPAAAPTPWRCPQTKRR